VRKYLRKHEVGDVGDIRCVNIFKGVIKGVRGLAFSQRNVRSPLAGCGLMAEKGLDSLRPV
jgi:hypothetical protein